MLLKLAARHYIILSGSPLLPFMLERVKKQIGMFDANHFIILSFLSFLTCI